MLKDLMIKNLTALKTKTTPIICLTAYSAPMAGIADQYCDLLLVGDSVSMVLYGAESTQEADMPMMIRHGKAVAKAATKAIVVVDMPYGSYEQDLIQALKNAQKIMDETGCDAIKLEGGAAQADTINYLTDNDIPVMAHIGLLPQSVAADGTYRVQGKDADAAEILKQDAIAVQEAGAFCMVIEAVPETLAAEITTMLGIPTIGIGASVACDGQILVTEDMLGLTLGKPPKFVKQYATLNAEIEKAIEQYANEVTSRNFPAKENTYGAVKDSTKTKEIKKAS